MLPGGDKERMMNEETKAQDVVKTTCGLCFTGCGMLVHMQDGKVVKIKGDPESPLNNGVLCAKGLAARELLYHPERLKHPLKRLGKRGEGNWQEISWDEALQTIAQEMMKAKRRDGAESVIFVHGAAKGNQEGYLRRFANVFGSPNVVVNGHVCFMPGWYAAMTTCGFFPFSDAGYPPSCLLVWGYNAHATCIPDVEATDRALNRGTKLIVVDPQKAGFAPQADLWLRPRPGSDLALALGMIHVIVNEGLFDKAFVEKWTVGFLELKAHVQSYDPRSVEKICWVPKEQIIEAARLYATTRPSSIKMGNALDHNRNSYQAARAIYILSAITGNLGVPGGDIQYKNLPILQRRAPEFTLEDKVTKGNGKGKISTAHGLLPIFPDVPNHLAIKAIVEEDPYPVRVAYIQGANPLLTYANAARVYQALDKLDFLVINEMFMTPTAELADIVLPVTSFLEFDGIVSAPWIPIAQIQQKVASVGECWPDHKILNELAKRTGLGQYFWEDADESLDFILEPFGVSFEEFKEIAVIQRAKVYRQHEMEGFETPSGKVEIFSSQLERWGFDPLPTYQEPLETPLNSPELAKEYPLVFTSCKSACFRHSGGRHIRTLREMHPEPVVKIHPKTARSLGVRDGDWLTIENGRGKIRQKAVLAAEIDPRVVIADYGWWFPERGAGSLYDWQASNINMLTSDEPPYSQEMGTTNLRGMMCKVSKA